MPALITLMFASKVKALPYLTVQANLDSVLLKPIATLPCAKTPSINPMPGSILGLVSPRSVHSISKRQMLLFWWITVSSVFSFSICSLAQVDTSQGTTCCCISWHRTIPATSVSHSHFNCRGPLGLHGTIHCECSMPNMNWTVNSVTFIG